MTFFEIKGKVLDVGETQSFGSSGFTKRGIILETKDESSKYSNPVRFVATKDNCKLLDGIDLDEVLTIRFAIDGRVWNGPKGEQYFTDLKILKVVREAESGSAPKPAVPSPEQEDIGAEDDGMPF